MRLSCLTGLHNFRAGECMEADGIVEIQETEEKRKVAIFFCPYCGTAQIKWGYNMKGEPLRK